MPETARQSLEVHDPDILAQARGVLKACESGQEMQEAVIAAVKRNEHWRGEQCLNLLAPEAPTSPVVHALLAAEVGHGPPKGTSARSIAGSPAPSTLMKSKPSAWNCSNACFAPATPTTTWWRV